VKILSGRIFASGHLREHLLILARIVRENCRHIEWLVKRLLRLLVMLLTHHDHSGWHLLCDILRVVVRVTMTVKRLLTIVVIQLLIVSSAEIALTTSHVTSYWDHLV
jgi:hypothetical protein